MTTTRDDSYDALFAVNHGSGAEFKGYCVYDMSLRDHSGREWLCSGIGQSRCAALTTRFLVCLLNRLPVGMADCACRRRLLGRVRCDGDCNVNATRVLNVDSVQLITPRMFILAHICAHSLVRAWVRPIRTPVVYLPLSFGGKRTVKFERELEHRENGDVWRVKHVIPCVFSLASA